MKVESDVLLGISEIFRFIRSITMGFVQLHCFLFTFCKQQISMNIFLFNDKQTHNTETNILDNCTDNRC